MRPHFSPEIARTAIHQHLVRGGGALILGISFLSGCTTVPLSPSADSRQKSLATKKSAGGNATRAVASSVLAKPLLPTALPGASRRDALVRPAAHESTELDPKQQIQQAAAAVADDDGTPEEVPAPPRARQAGGSHETAEKIDISGTKPPASPGHPVNLFGVLQLVDSQNPQVAFARERIQEAYAQQLRAQVLWLPSLRAGVNYNHHDGAIQAVEGRVFNTSRGAFYSGLGAAVPGAASPAVPGISAQFHLTDAIFQPRIAEQVACSRKASATAATNDFLLDAALAYLELQRADSELAIAREALKNTQELARVTGEYAKTGQGLPSDHDRALAELAVRRNDVRRAEEATKVASARLAQLLSVDARNLLQPEEPNPVAIELTGDTSSEADLVAHGLQCRPEAAESRHLVGEAVERLQRDRYAPLIPSVLLGASYGGYGGGFGSNFPSFNDRFDADAVAYWEIRNLGFGEKAARAEAGSRLEQARLREVAVLDRIAREIVEAHTQVEARRSQIPIAQEGVQAAISSHRRNQERMRNAQGLPIEVLQSIQALAQARREYLRSIIDYDKAQFTLQRALGKPIEPTGVPSEQ